MNNDINCKFLFLFIAFVNFSLYAARAQKQTIHGQIRMQDGTSLANASVILKHMGGIVIVFTSTNAEGLYSLKVPDSVTLEKLSLQVNYLGLKKVSLNLVSSKLEYNILMVSSAITLADVKIKSKPILNAKGDTLSYNVHSFSQEQDRSIGDVLKRMPGIEVEENGRIKYNGKNISNMYIGGDDLLNGKYALGTRTIPLEVIQSVDVMQNHQPIKVFQNRAQSDDVALNLVIKNDANLTISGQAMLGSGLPNQYDAALNTILFNKKFKMLNVLQANNNGLDYRRDIQNFGYGGFLNAAENDRPESLITSGTIQEPDLPQKRFYLNNSVMLNANNLRNYSSGLQLKSNVNFLLDRNRFNYNSQSNFNLIDNTVEYSENQASLRKPLIFGATIKAMMNKNHYYLNNDLKINVGSESNEAQMAVNRLEFGQLLKTKVRDFSNDFRFSPLLKNGNLMDFSWYLNFYNNPQQLWIDSGINPAILNNGIPYSSLSEYAQTPTYFSNASLSYRLISKAFRQNYRIGLINEMQRLNSQIELTSLNGIEYPYAQDNGNNVRWRRSKLSLFAGYEWKKNQLEAAVNLPLSFQGINYDQDSELQKHTFLVISPAAKIKLRTTAEDYIQINGNYNRNFGNISGIYQSAILTSYRTVQSNSGELKEEEFSGAGIFYNLQRSLSMFFFNVGINYNRISSNTISAILLNNNIEQSILIPTDNNINSWNIKIGMSKYLFDLNTTASLKLAWSLNQFKQFYNSEPLDYNNEEKLITLGLESKLFKKLSLSYSGTARFGNSYLTTNREDETTIERYDQNLSLTASLIKNLTINLKSRQIISNRSGFDNISYLFTDFVMKVKLVKIKLDFEFELNNLTNIKNYQLLQIRNNKFSSGNYQLRGINSLLRATFFI